MAMTFNTPVTVHSQIQDMLMNNDLDPTIETYNFSVAAAEGSEIYVFNVRFNQSNRKLNIEVMHRNAANNTYEVVKDSHLSLESFKEWVESNNTVTLDGIHAHYEVEGAAELIKDSGHYW